MLDMSLTGGPISTFVSGSQKVFAVHAMLARY